MPRVRVKYCGHCNPQGDGLDLVKAIEKLAPDLEFFSWGCEEGDALLIYSACPVGCVSVPQFGGSTLHVICDTVNGKKYAADDLPRALLDALRELLGKRPAGLLALRAPLRVSRCRRLPRKENLSSWKKSL